MDIQKTYFYKNIYHNANPDHDEEDANSESTTFCCCYTEKKKFCPFVPQCNYRIFAQYDIFISCKCHFGGIVRGVFEISNS